MNSDRKPRTSNHTTANAAARWRSRLIVVALIAVILPVGVVILRNNSPTGATFYPRCVFFVVTGLYCPGCGGTRCLHALLNGRIAEAVAYNPILVVTLPLIVVALGLECYAAWTGHRLIRRRLPTKAIYAIFWLFLAYWIARNIDIYPLSLLAPHRLETVEAGEEPAP